MKTAAAPENAMAERRKVRFSAGLGVSIGSVGNEVLQPGEKRWKE